MSPRIKIECLPEPALLFADGVTGVEPRRALAKAGAADMQPGCSIRIGLVGPAEEDRLARKWLPRLNRVAIARERSAHRYRDWPGAEKALGASFALEDRVVRALDQDARTLALSRSAPEERFDALLDLFDEQIQSKIGDLRPECNVTCFPDAATALRIHK